MQRANKPIRPTRREQILRARRLVAEALSELDQRTGKVCHVVITWARIPDIFYGWSALAATTILLSDAEG
jgi:hypothetical protein